MPDTKKVNKKGINSKDIKKAAFITITMRMNDEFAWLPEALKSASKEKDVPVSRLCRRVLGEHFAQYKA